MLLETKAYARSNQTLILLSLILRHWLGLFHTFQDGCSKQGDKIDDTPAQAKAVYGCAPENRTDSCPNSPGLDPIFNFMGYSDDVCLYEFTPDQRAAIRDTLLTYRTPGTNIDPEQAVILRGGASSRWDDSLKLSGGSSQLLVEPVPKQAMVSCQITTQDNDSSIGNLDLFMNWNGELEYFDCQSETANFSNETCTIGPGKGKAYILVYSAAATTASTEFTVSCEHTLV